MRQKIQKAYEAAQFVHALMCDKDGYVKNINISEYELSCACQARRLSLDLVMLGVKSLMVMHKTCVEINEFDPSWGYDRFVIGSNSWHSGGICGLLLHFPTPLTKNGELLDYWRTKGYNEGKNKCPKRTLPNKYNKYQYTYDVYYEDGYEDACEGL